MRLKDVYICSACGNQSLVWQGQCPACREWNTMSARQAGREAKAGGTVPAAGQPRLLEEVDPGELKARSTGFAPLDQLLGQGLIPGGTILLGGEPGIGKSTLLLQLAGRMAEDGRRAIYISGEESLAQLRGRAERLNLLGRGLPAVATTSLEEALGILEPDGGEQVELVIIDSVQTLSSAAEGGLPGSVSQVRAVAAALTEVVKKSGCTLLLVGHVTKEGHLAGPKLLEHMVDTVLSLEGDRRNFHRILRVLKNRFGPSDELLVLEMGRQGLSFVADPSTYFLGDRDDSLPGSALVMAVEGRRPFVVEVQALVNQSLLGTPRRTALGFDSSRLGLLLAVMERHLGLNLGQADVYCKIGGGLKLADPGLDLGIVAAVLSSFQSRCLPAKSICWGEVDLNGLVRPCGAHELRSKQAKRLGYGPMFFSRQGKAGSGTLTGFAQAVFG